MDIKSISNAVNAYKVSSFEKADKNIKTVSPVKKNVDKVEFSVSRPENVDQVKTSIRDTINDEASQERLSQLRSSIENGNYSVSAETVALSILG